MTSATIDLETGRFAVAGYGGIAFYSLGYAFLDSPDYEWTGVREVDHENVRMVMVGDDREHIIPVEDLTPLEDEDYCGQCGQIGCTHDGRERRAA